MAYPVERKPAHAGSFYPAGKAELDAMLTELLSRPCGEDRNGVLRGLVVPHAGYVYSAKTAAAGYCKLQAMPKQPSNFILLGPSHNALFGGLATCSFRLWRTPLGAVVSESIQGLCGKSEILLDSAEAFVPEHCLEVQLPFLQKTCRRDFKIFPCLTSETDAGSVAEYLAPALGSRGNFLIVSSDLSHFLSRKQAEKVDGSSSEIITGLDLNKADAIDACGKTGIVTAMLLARKFGWVCSKLDYSTSFDASGDDQRVVGYGSYGLYEKS
jgi:MEMO1 family protein